MSSSLHVSVAGPEEVGDLASWSRDEIKQEEKNGRRAVVGSGGAVCRSL
jgi:hypothetical protein